LVVDKSGRNYYFVGYESQLNELKAKLFQEKGTTIIAITGAGGTGKSQLALELAYLTKDTYDNCSVFWIDASDTDSLDQSYRTVAQKLRIPNWDNGDIDVKLLVKDYLSRGSNKWLLVYDNVEDIGLRPARSSLTLPANLVRYLPQSHSGSIVITTTNSDTAKTLAEQNIVQIEKMTPSTGQKLLENYLGVPVPTSERQGMKLLLEKLSYLPLAIVQAAAYIKRNNITLKDYWALLVEARNRSPRSDKGCFQSRLNELL